jgi:hypothetical protein
MSIRNSEETRSSSAFASAGWLFADLLLVLAMLFLAANTMGIHPPPPEAKATPTPTPSPTPHALAALDPTIHSFSFHVNVDDLLNDRPAATQIVKDTFKNQKFIKNRKAGMMLVYPTCSLGKDVYYRVVSKITAIVQNLGSTDQAYSAVIAYHPLCNDIADQTSITIEILLFYQSM